MATHLLTLKGNYIWLDDLANDKRYEGLAKEILVRSDLDVSTVFYFDGLNQFDKNTGIEFTDIDVNGNGAFATLAEWQDWYTANTGNFNGGGSAPTTKQGAYQVYHDGEAYQIIKVGNGLGYDLTLTKTGVGTYEVTGFTDNLSGGRGYVFCDKSIPEYLDGTVLKKVCYLSFNTEDGVLTLTILDITTQLPTDELLTSFDLLFTVIL